ncbi:MAG: response regulator [Planctomycetes bacterium]|nr:response regulator [Planctomycetota bacterium]
MCRLLVADANRANADSLAKLLRTAGFDVATAYDGGHAIEQAVTFEPDIFLLELAMPVLDGYQVASHLKGMPKFADKVFIALTAYADQRHMDLASQADFQDYLVKPIELSMLMSILAEVSG